MCTVLQKPAKSQWLSEFWVDSAKNVLSLSYRLAPTHMKLPKRSVRNSYFIQFSETYCNKISEYPHSRRFWWWWTVLCSQIWQRFSKSIKYICEATVKVKPEGYNNLKSFCFGGAFLPKNCIQTFLGDLRFGKNLDNGLIRKILESTISLVESSKCWVTVVYKESCCLHLQHFWCCKNRKSKWRFFSFSYRIETLSHGNCNAGENRWWEIAVTNKQGDFLVTLTFTGQKICSLCDVDALKNKNIAGECSTLENQERERPGIVSFGTYTPPP